jgi:hypothetical protein
MRRVNRELDMAKFLKNSFLIEGLIKGITTKGQQ